MGFFWISPFSGVTGADVDDVCMQKDNMRVPYIPCSPSVPCASSSAPPWGSCRWLLQPSSKHSIRIMYKSWSARDILRMLPSAQKASTRRWCPPWTPNHLWSCEHKNIFIYCKSASLCYQPEFALRLWPVPGGTSRSSVHRLRQWVCNCVPGDVVTPMIYKHMCTHLYDIL